MNAAAGTLDSLQAKHEELIVCARIRELERLIKDEELAGRFVESEFGDVVDRREHLYDTPGWGPGGYDRRSTSPGDRARGKCTPFFENETDLAGMRGIGRYLAGATEIGVGALEALTNFTIGTGFVYEAEPRNEKQHSAALIREVQWAVDEILEANQWIGDQEEESFLRASRDGETILWVQDQGGMPLVRIVEPDYVTEPAQVRELEEYLGTSGLDWSFGIGTEKGRHDRPYGYFIQWEGSAGDWDVAPAGEVVHIKCNVDRMVKRGISDFYAAFLTLERASKLLGNTLQGSAIQACIAYIREHAAGTTADQITPFANSKRDATVHVPRPVGGSKTRSQERWYPGKVVDAAGFKYHAAPLGTPNGPLFVQIVQAALRIVGVRWQMPEYLVSGDASNANYSSTLAAGGPFDRASRRRQCKYKRPFAAMLWIGLGHLIRRGRFRQFGIGTLTELKREVQLQVTAPGVAIANQAEEENIRAIRADRGILSKKTWSGQVDLDYDVEQANLREEPRQEPEPPPSPIAAAMESVRTIEEARAILLECGGLESIYP